MPTKKKVSLITGLTGFIGKHLSDKLLAENHRVVALPRELLVDPVSLSKYLLEVDPDYIFHLATYGNHSTQTEEDEIFVSNIFKTYNLLRAADAVKYKKFINISTSSVYGKECLAPMAETDATNPDTFYATTKLISEQLVSYFGHAHDKNIINIRPFSVYGEGEADFRFIPTVIDSILTGKSFKLYSDPVHDWIYVRDFVEAVYLLAVSKDKIDGPINIGTGDQYTNREVVELLSNIGGKKANYETKEGGRGYDSTYWCADTSKLFEVTGGWQPKFDLEGGLRYTYAYYEQGSKKKNN